MQDILSKNSALSPNGLDNVSKNPTKNESLEELVVEVVALKVFHLLRHLLF